MKSYYYGNVKPVLHQNIYVAQIIMFIIFVTIGYILLFIFQSKILPYW
jgi:hypothetical protein